MICPIYYSCFIISEPVAESDPTLPSISLQQKEQLCERRCFESEQMMYKFQKLFTDTKRSLRGKKVPVDELVGHLECLGSIKPTYVDIGRSPLRSQLPGLADAKTVDAVMSVVKSRTTVHSSTTTWWSTSLTNSGRSKTRRTWPATKRTSPSMPSAALHSVLQRLGK